MKVQYDPVHDSPTNQNENGWGLQVVDYFTPYNQAALSSGDLDLGSGGPILLPASVGSAAHPNLLVGGGKTGEIFLIDAGTDNSALTMGEYHSGTNDVVQDTNPGSGGFGTGDIDGILSAPTYFDGNIYFTPGYGSNLQEFSISDAHMASDGSSSDTFGGRDGGNIISADGTANGILWDLNVSSGTLRAYSASDLNATNPGDTSELYNSPALPGGVAKFSVPMVANGDVYAGTLNSLVMFGLNTAPPTTVPAAPTNLVATSVQGSEVSLAWTNPANNNESAFYVYRSTDGVNYTQIGINGVDQTTFSDTTVQPFTSYYYKVAAYNVVGLSGYSNVVNVLTLGQPSIGGGDGLLGQYYANNNSFATSTTLPTMAPTLVRVDPDVDFNWNFAGPSAAVGQRNYEVVWTGEVQAQYSENYTFSTISDDGCEVFINGQAVITDLHDQGPTLTSSAPIALTAGQSYSITVLYFQASAGAEMDLDWSSPHTPTEAIPQSQLFSGSAPAAPSNLQVAAISATQTQLNWTESSTDPTGYQVDRELVGSGSFASIAFLPAGTDQYVDTVPTAGATYIYEVEATNFVANSLWSSPVTVAMPVLPNVITNAVPTVVTANSIAMTWTNNADNGTQIRIFYLTVAGGGNPTFVTGCPPPPHRIRPRACSRASRIPFTCKLGI